MEKGDLFSKGDSIGTDFDFEAAKTKKLEPNPELDNFLGKVDEITEIIHGLASDDATVQEKAMRKADLLLGDKRLSAEDFKTDDVEEEPCSSGSVKYRVRSSRTVINTKPSNTSRDNESCGDGATSQAAFMSMVEKDANERARDRTERKERSDRFRKAGVGAFRDQNFAEALDNFNKAIGLIKDSPCLYNNRALTYLRIGIYSKAIEDCDQAMYLAEGSIKAHLLKAKAYFMKEEPQKCRRWLNETREKFASYTKMIDEYEKELFEMRFLDAELRKKKPVETSNCNGDTDQFKNHDPDEIWRRAARHEIFKSDFGVESENTTLD